MTPTGRSGGEHRSARREGAPVTRDGGAVARNMSAPPRTKLNFRALARVAGATGDPVADGMGLAFVCRLSTDAAIPKRWRSRLARSDAAAPLAVDERIRLAYARVHAETAHRARASPAALAHALAAPVEALADALRDAVAAFPLVRAGMPPVGVFLPPGDGDRPVEASLVRTIAILGRRRGGVFVRDAEPLVWTALDGVTLDLWAPRPRAEAA